MLLPCERQWNREKFKTPPCYRHPGSRLPFLNNWNCRIFIRYHRVIEIDSGWNFNRHVYSIMEHTTVSFSFTHYVFISFWGEEKSNIKEKVLSEIMSIGSGMLCLLRPIDRPIWEKKSRRPDSDPNVFLPPKPADRLPITDSCSNTVPDKTNNRARAGELLVWYSYTF